VLCCFGVHGRHPARLLFSDAGLAQQLHCCCDYAAALVFWAPTNGIHLIEKDEAGFFAARHLEQLTHHTRTLRKQHSTAQHCIAR
jgi:hypothetical protein